MKIRIAALVVLLTTGGCSFVFVDGPPAQHRQMPYFDCTKSRFVPVLDVIFSALQIANFSLAAGKSDEEWDEMYDGDAPIERGPSMGLYAGLAALGSVSAYVGFKRTSKCRDAKGELMIRQRGMQPAYPQQPGTWPPAPAPPAPPAPVQPAPVPPPAPAPPPPQ